MRLKKVCSILEQNFMLVKLSLGDKIMTRNFLKFGVAGAFIILAIFMQALAAEELSERVDVFAAPPGAKVSKKKTANSETGAQKILLSPVLMGQVTKDGEQGPIRMTKLDAQVTFQGPLVETSMTMTFKNSLGREVAGELLFPLPDGVTISGYAIDIDGELRDAVAVTKTEARIALNSEIKKGVDPGVAEWAMGNVFRTEIYPIMPGATRTVRVSYIQPFAGERYEFPLTFEHPVEKFSLQAKLIGEQSALRITGLSDVNKKLTTKKSQTGLIAFYSAKNTKLKTSMVIELPKRKLKQAYWEIGTDGNYYGIGSLRDLKLSTPRTAMMKPSAYFIRVVYDMSRSRENADHFKELTQLREFVKFMSVKNRKPSFVLYILRNDLQKISLPKNANVDNVISAILREMRIEKLTPKKGQALARPYKAYGFDGGTDFSALYFPPDPLDDYPIDLWYTLVFTDGMSSLPASEKAFTVEDSRLRVYGTSAMRNQYLISRAIDKNRKALGSAAERVDEVDIYEIVNAGMESKVQIANSKLAILTPKFYEKMHFAMQVKKDVIKNNEKFVVEVSSSRGNEIGSGRYDYSGKKIQAYPGKMIQKYFANQRLIKLMRDKKANREEIIALGKKFGIVTPYTSLIVLETAAQYAAYGIEPPKKYKELYKDYLLEKETAQEDLKYDQKLHMEKLRKFWDERIKWWKSDFKKLPLKPKAVAPAKPEQSKIVSVPEVILKPVPKAQESWKDDDGSRDGDGGAASGASSGAGIFGDDDGEEPSAEPVEGVTKLSRWSPRAPYITALENKLKLALPGNAISALDIIYAEYLKFSAKPRYAKNPGFYFDIAAWMRNVMPRYINADPKPMREHSRACWQRIIDRVLTSVAETRIDSPEILRMLAYQYEDQKNFKFAVRLFEHILEMREEEMQSYRDLALALEARADFTPDTIVSAQQRANDYARAIKLLWSSASKKRVDYDSVKFAVVALEEMNNCIAKLNRLRKKRRVIISDKCMIPAWAVKNLDMDLRITLSWDTDNTDVDLHVIDPYGEKTYYAKKLSVQGGKNPFDATGG